MSAGTQNSKPVNWPVAALWAGLAVTLLVFFGAVPRFGPGNLQSGFSWLVSNWTAENNYEHGWLVVGVAGWLLWRAWPVFRQSLSKQSGILGLGMLAMGILMFLAGWRTIQPRIAVAACPVIMMGCLVYAHGWAKARPLVFPLSMFAFVIPMPGFQQMTTGLQIIATKMAHHGASIFGINTVLAGNQVYSPDGHGGSWQIDEGCSGIRSLVALMLVTYVYGMIVHKKWFERFIIFAACVPIAIIANAVRVTSILLVGRYNPEFAKNTWHDYSGFLSFGAALGLLMMISAVMRQGLRALKPKVTVTKIGAPPAAAAAPRPGAAQGKREERSTTAVGSNPVMGTADPY